jgi:hypothetical protein
MIRKRIKFVMIPHSGMFALCFVVDFIGFIFLSYIFLSLAFFSSLIFR